jgi:hypothetical protein
MGGLSLAAEEGSKGSKTGSLLAEVLRQSGGGRPWDSCCVPIAGAFEHKSDCKHVCWTGGSVAGGEVLGNGQQRVGNLTPEALQNWIRESQLKPVTLWALLKNAASVFSRASLQAMGLTGLQNPFARLVRRKVDREAFQAPSRPWIMNLMRQGGKELRRDARLAFVLALGCRLRWGGDYLFDVGECFAKRSEGFGEFGEGTTAEDCSHIQRAFGIVAGGAVWEGRQGDHGRCLGSA